MKKLFVIAVLALVAGGLQACKKSEPAPTDNTQMAPAENSVPAEPSTETPPPAEN